MLTLLIVTKKFGKNFTGATLATQYLIERWQKVFNRIYVFTLEMGDYDNIQANVTIRVCKNERELCYFLRRERANHSANVIGYSDDHLGYLMSREKIPYIHTYHGNWPDARWVNAVFFLKSFYFIPMYAKTIHGAKTVINVSKYMEHFTKKYNSNSIVIRNGMDFKPCGMENSYPETYVMVGNIDVRKYRKAVELAKSIYRLDPTVQIDVFGKIIDYNIAKLLENLPNVHLRGQYSKIPYSVYRGLINTSEIENLSISVCEAIKSGIPVFCYNVGGLPEVVKENETGYVIERNNVTEMAQRIVDYAHCSNRMTVNQQVMDPFDWNVATESYITEFKKVMKDEIK